MNINRKKVVAATFSLVLMTGVIPSNVSFLKNVSFVNSVSAASSIITSGNWQYTLLDDNTAEIFKYIGTAKDVIVPATIDNHSVKSFKAWAFSGNQNITSVSLQRGISEIPQSAFLNATNLKTVSLPSGIKKIGNRAFEGTSLSSISLPYSLEEMGHEVFKNTNLTSITLPPLVETIGRSAFYGCEKLKNINMNTITFDSAASSGAFIGCTNLSSINNICLVNYDSKGRPYFAQTYRNSILQNFEKFDLDSIGFFNEYLKAEIHYIATTETAGCISDAQKIRKLHDWVCNKVEYAYTENMEPDMDNKNCVDSSVFLNDRTICQGYARALTLLLREVGIEAYHLLSSTHAWTMVKLGNKYFHLDACHSDGLKDSSHYLKSDTDIKKCSRGHDPSWQITVPSLRFTYTQPSTLPTCKYSLGDINMDGKLDNADVKLMQAYLNNSANLPITDNVLADINGDNNINLIDGIALIRLVNGQMF